MKNPLRQCQPSLPNLAGKGSLGPIAQNQKPKNIGPPA